MKRSLTLLGFAVFLLLALPVYSLEIVNFEDTEGKTFYPEDFVDLGTVLINDENNTLNLFVEQYVLRPGIDPMPLYEEFTIKPDGDVMISDMSFIVSEYLFPGKYTHMVRVRKSGEIVAEKTTKFYVTGTKEKLSDFEILICADHGCKDLRPVLILGETAYIRVECLENPEISGYVVHDGDTTTLSFDEGLASFKAVSEGTYIANVIFSKDGFFTENIERDITFVKEGPKVIYYFCSDVKDGVCEDCPDGDDPDCGKITFGYEYAIVLVVILVIFFLIGLFFFRKSAMRV